MTVMVKWVAIFVVVIGCGSGENVRRWAWCDCQNHFQIQRVAVIADIDGVLLFS